jgi:hypothetical protein
MKFRNLAAAAAVCLTAGLAIAQSTFVAGLDAPIKLFRTSAGNLLVSEGGTTNNTGRVSLIDRAGGRVPLLSGLPSVKNAEGTSGPTGLLLRGSTLYLLIGGGDAVVRGTRPGTEVPNPAGVSSPIFSSLLSVQFSANPETLVKGFQMTVADHATLADGFDVKLDNGAGVTATVTLLSDFRDITPDANTIVRSSNPFGIEFDVKVPISSTSSTRE